jgi:hypothetical protein
LALPTPIGLKDEQVQVNMAQSSVAVSGRNRMRAAVRRINHHHDDDRLALFDLPVGRHGIVAGPERALGLAVNPQEKTLFVRLGWRR